MPNFDAGNLSMTKAILYTIAIFTVFAAVSIYILAQREDVSTKEGFLYSAVGCISVYKKLDQPEKVDQLLNLIHHFSTEQDIKEIQPGYITRFIKLIEKKWEKDNAVAQKNCSGILKMATGYSKPQSYNAVTEGVISYLLEIESNMDK